jgi:hypothetical protein
MAAHSIKNSSLPVWPGERLTKAEGYQLEGKAVVIARRFCLITDTVIQEPYEMLPLPSPWTVSVPEISNCCLDGLRLTKVALAPDERYLWTRLGFLQIWNAVENLAYPN